jgi:hypothetical protein
MSERGKNRAISVNSSWASLAPETISSPCDVCKLPDAGESKRFEVLTREPCMAACHLHAAATHKNRLQVSGIDALQTPRNSASLCTVSARALMWGILGFSFIQNGMSPTAPLCNFTLGIAKIDANDRNLIHRSYVVSRWKV